ncbi:hypothetical protein Tco_0834474 [Tanacetum coccineum]
MIRLRAESPSTSHPLSVVLSRTRASMAMMRAAAPSTYILASRSKTPQSRTPPLLPIPLPTLLPPLLLPSTDCRAGVFEVTLPPQKRRDYGFVTTLDDEIRRDLERDVSYGITDTWDEMVEDMQGTPSVTYVAELSQSMIDFVMTIRQDTNEIDGRLDDAQDDRSLMSGQFNLLRMDKRAHARTARLIEIKARLSRDTQMAVLESQQTPARDPVHLDVPEEAGSSS